MNKALLLLGLMLLLPVAALAHTLGVDKADYLAGSGSMIAGAKRYTLLGIQHILIGIDHLSFVLALMFVVGGGWRLAAGGWRLVKRITAFTIAHSITLGLATLGYINLPPAPVEASIALSIVFLCVEIIHAQQGRVGITFKYPWVVAFSFGLLHGLGFAGALSEIGLPPAEIPLALLFFNIGVELGQLIFVFVVLTLMAALKYGVGLTHDSRLFLNGERATVYLIGTLASYWLIERSASMF